MIGELSKQEAIKMFENEMDNTRKRIEEIRKNPSNEDFEYNVEENYCDWFQALNYAVMALRRELEGGLTPMQLRRLEDLKEG